MVGSMGGSNDTKACQASSSCALTCQSPQFGSNECVSYSSSFIDGSPCGGDGHCSNGDCTGSSTLGDFKNWIEHHKPIFIPAAIVVGLLVLGVLFCCLSSCFKKRGGPRRGPSPPQMQQSWPGYENQNQNQNQWAGPPRPMMSGGVHQDMGMPPPPPPPEFTQQRGWMARSSSVRYA